MDNYIGVKLIKAEPMKAEEANRVLQRPIDLTNADDEFNGYLVEYQDGYQSWSPKEIFEAAYMKVTPNPKLKTNCSISQDMVNDFIKEIYIDTVGEKNTIVRVVLVNGFELIESSACVDPANYDEVIGADICLGKIKDKIWMLLGFLLQTGVGGVKK